jgi:integrase
MAILQECPNCKNKQSLRNKSCKCGQNLDTAKRSRTIRYWINYRVPDGTPNGKQRREYVGNFEDMDGYSIEDARTADAKRKVSKAEGRLMLDVLQQSKITFEELSEWYLDLQSIKSLSSYDRVKQAIGKFNEVFGEKKIGSIKPVDLENYQQKRLAEGRAFATIDMEIKIVQTAVTKAFDNDMVGGDALKAFRKVKRLLKARANARKQTVSVEQYKRLLNEASPHYRAVLTIAYSTGMRLGEIKNLKWSYIDRDAMMIRLPSDAVKERRAKIIPINHHVESVIDALPRALKHDYVITYRGTPLNGVSSLKKQFPETCQKAGISHGRNTPGGITFHDIRRTVKTNMLQAGIEKTYRDSILGHSLTGMDAHYIVITDEALTAAMEQYTKWLDGQIKNVDKLLTQTESK